MPSLNPPLIFRQLFDPASSTYTYLLGDSASGEALIIDPVFEHQRRDAALLRATTELFVLDVTHDSDEIRRYEELATHFLPKVGLADRLFGHRIDEAADNRQGNIRFQQRDAHFAHGIADVLFLKRTAPALPVKDAA